MRAPSLHQSFLSQCRAASDDDDSAAADIAFGDDALLFAQCDDSHAIEYARSRLAANTRAILTKYGFRFNYKPR